MSTDHETDDAGGVERKDDESSVRQEDDVSDVGRERDVHAAIDRAARVVGRAWPLHSFVTSNPLAGFEDRPFPDAVRAGERSFGGRGYPRGETFRRAWETGRIDPELLRGALADRGVETAPDSSLDRLIEADETATSGESATDERDATNGGGATAGVAHEKEREQVDRLVTKWLAAFLDGGTAHWSMPNREEEFYAAVRSLARHDRAIPDRERLAVLPSEPVAATEELLADHPSDRWEEIFGREFAALPGWTAFVARRAESDDPWQSAHPITLPGYLAVRLAVTDPVGASLVPSGDGNGATASETSETERDGRREAWLSAWETTYRRELVEAVTDRADAHATETDLGGGGRSDGQPDAQLVFCIDTRSEVIRRHVERAGNYETRGYAGFFGVPMRYEGCDAAVPTDACPPILDAGHRIRERPTDDAGRDGYDRLSALLNAGRELTEGLGSNPATAFGFVESAGLGYGTALAARVRRLAAAATDRVAAVHEFCRPSIDHEPAVSGDLSVGVTSDERVEYAATAFELMGREEFARLVVFVGHASETANDPFEASLDCGACAGNPGGPNARVLARICNEEAVRAGLRERGIEIPEETVFLAGRHDTTTDEVTPYDDWVPESHDEDLARLRRDPATARTGAAAERLGEDSTPDDGRDGGEDATPAANSGTERADEWRDERGNERIVRETERRAGDWAETRPEWRSAGNAGFVIGPRALTEDLHLDNRVFLHSYDPATDPDGDALEAILTGPMVVTQWINTAYYFATTDTAVYGSGSKVTRNPVGDVGVYQGNGGDLLTGLPTQSVMRADDDPYHQPLRLSTVVYAPVERVRAVLADHEQVARLSDNDWLSSVVVDPTRDDRAFAYAGDGKWEPWSASASEVEPTAFSSVTDSYS